MANPTTSSIQTVKGIGLVALSILLNGCLHDRSTYDVRELYRDRSYWFNYDASRRGAILSPKKSKEDLFHMCAEPSPDIALQTAINQLGKLNVSADSSKGQAEILAQKEFSTKVVELASRTQTILFLREAMYRLCEQQMNGAIESKDAKSLYEAVVDTSITLAEAQVIETLSKVGNSDQAKQLLEVFVEGQLGKRKLEQHERKIQAQEHIVGLFEKYDSKNRAEEMEALLSRHRRADEDLRGMVRERAREDASRAIEFEAERIREETRRETQATYFMKLEGLEERLKVKDAIIKELEERAAAKPASLTPVFEKVSPK